MLSRLSFCINFIYCGYAFYLFCIVFVSIIYVYFILLLYLHPLFVSRFILFYMLFYLFLRNGYLCVLWHQLHLCSFYCLNPSRFLTIIFLFLSFFFLYIFISVLHAFYLYWTRYCYFVHSSRFWQLYLLLRLSWTSESLVANKLLNSVLVGTY